MAYNPTYYNPYQMQTSAPMDRLQQLQAPYQMTQMPMQAPQQPNGGIIWVGSEMEAANYLMAPNSAVALWNSNAPCIYLKQTDASGKPTMKTYDLVERSNLPVESPKDLSAEFVTRKEFDALKSKFDALTARRTKKETAKEVVTDGESV